MDFSGRSFLSALLPLLLLSCLCTSAQLDSSQSDQWKKIRQYQTTHDSIALAQTYHQLAAIKQFGLEQDSALYYFLKCRELFLALRNEREVNLINISIGHWYLGNGGNAEAMEYFRDGYNYFLRQRDTMLIAHSLANLALAHERMGNTDSALFYRKQSLPISFQIKDSFLVMINLWTLSEIYRDKGSYSEALQLGDEALIWSEMNQKNNIHHSAILFNKGEILRLSGNCDEALNLFEQTLQAIPAGIIQDVRARTYLSMSNCFESTGQFEKALKSLQLYQQVNDQIQNEKRQKSIEHLRIQFETENKEKEIGLLQQQNLLISAEAARKKRFYIVLSIALGALVSISALAYFINRKRLHAQQLIHLQSEKIHQQQIIELEQQHHIDSMKEILAGQDGERERIARDLHDSLGGLLSGIKMHFQKLRSPDSNGREQLEETTSDLINQACDSVRTISHNMMPDALTKFGLKEALNDLVEKSNLPGLTIWLNCHGLESRMEREKELAIYRIVEEAISNIIKHAKASEVFINVLRNENLISLSIEDNGVGFDPEKISDDSSGLSNMKSRVSILKGSFNIESLPARGTFISIVVPV